MNEPANAEQRVMDGSTWSEFCDALKEAGSLVDAENAPQDAFTQDQIA